MKSQSKLYSRYFTYIKPVTKIPFVRTYGSTIFTLFTITIFIFYAIKPTVETILVLQKKLADSNEVLQKVEQKSKDLAQGKQNYDNLDPAIKTKIDSLIPDTVSLKTVIQTLEQTAKLHDATVSALQIQPLVIDVKNDNKTGALTEVGFTFNTVGEYQNLISLLQELKNSVRLISIDSVSISKLPEGAGLIMSIAGKGYYIK